MSKLADPWQIRVDTGGTFTDGIAVAPDGSRRRVKILSTSALRGTVVEVLDGRRLRIDEGWDAPAGLIDGFEFRVLGGDGCGHRVAGYEPGAAVLELSEPVDRPDLAGAAFEVRSDEEAPLLAARLLTGTPAGRSLPPTRMRLATTLGTNALLQRGGVPTALFITRGFGDLLRIGTQQRPDLFRLDVVKPAPLFDVAVEVDERLDRDGRVLVPLDLAALREPAERLVARGVRVAAIAFLHSHRNADHERRLRARLLEWGFEHVSCSAVLAPRIKLLQRAQTAVVDAYLSPVVRTYLDRVEARLGSGDLLVMTSAGGLLDPAGYRPKDSLLSGPAGGVVGAAVAGRDAGRTRVISFDMGGTSTDVARYDGDYEYRYEHHVGDAHLAAPALALETVASGGGSVCWLDGERLRVGPRSAGAQPGPACYGAGGPLTLTDVNLLLGRLDAERFDIPVRLDPARERLAELCSTLERRGGTASRSEALLEGLLAIADETMADAIRRVSLRQGYDPAEYALVSFGGAGGQHACGVAERLGIREIVVPPDAALLSAHGLGHAVVERFVERQVLRPLRDATPRLGASFDEMAAEAIDAVTAAGVPAAEIEIRRRIAHLRFAGQDASLQIDWEPGAALGERFEETYEKLFGHRPERREVEVESIRIVASSPAPLAPSARSIVDATRVESRETARSWFDGAWIDVPTFDRESLSGGDEIAGPALIFERHSTTVVESDWTACVNGSGALVLSRSAAAASTSEARPEAVQLELFTQRFYTLVREMGERLERTAVSTNVKERLDFSCALLDIDGDLVVNAPHIPVHLGALGLCVRSLRDALHLEDGDVVVTNHPSYGGSHLPDVTVVTPVFSPDDSERLVGYVASRAHHAEIGGSRPGSMPPAASCLAEEGVVIPPTRVIRGGRTHWREIRALLEGGPYPTRNVEDNLADLRAAVAANHAGAVALRGLVESWGESRIARYMDRLKSLAESRIREALSRIDDGSYRAEERLDDGSALCVSIDLEDDSARIDFEGTAGVHPGNLNATPAIVQSAVLYVLRLLLREPLPLNEGLLRAVSIHVPRGLLNPDFPEDPLLAPAVVGGNVETSQRLVDTLIKALGLAACSQGTMNNLIFGNPRYGYYETLGGGCGATSASDGADGVHSHMTNTRITDPEVLEHRYPVRVERFAVRRGSGGRGRHRGGDGLVREIRFLEPASLSVLTQHRVVRPYGLEGGEPGACGRQRVLRVGGEELELGSVDGCEVEAGDRVVVETPGGGGHGPTD